MSRLKVCVHASSILVCHLWLYMYCPSVFASLCMGHLCLDVCACASCTRMSSVYVACLDEHVICVFRCTYVGHLCFHPVRVLAYVDFDVLNVE